MWISGNRNEILSLLIQRDFQLVGKFVGIERAQRKISAFDFNRRHFAFSVVYLKHDRFRRRVFINIDFAERDASFPQEAFCAAAITAPGIGINGYFSHFFLRYFFSITPIGCPE